MPVLAGRLVQIFSLAVKACHSETAKNYYLYEFFSRLHSVQITVSLSNVFDVNWFNSAAFFWKKLSLCRFASYGKNQANLANFQKNSPQMFNFTKAQQNFKKSTGIISTLCIAKDISNLKFDEKSWSV